jgi:hypothetical protein
MNILDMELTKRAVILDLGDKCDSRDQSVENGSCSSIN